MAINNSSRITPGIAVAAVIGCLLMAVLAAGSLYQATQHHNKNNDAQSHENIATMFQTAENEGKAASDSLQQFVATGDAAFIAAAQSHTQTGVQQLTSAVALVGSDPNGFVDKGSQMVQASGQVIALRQTGDAAGAAQLLKTWRRRSTASSLRRTRSSLTSTRLQLTLAALLTALRH